MLRGNANGFTVEFEMHCVSPDSRGMLGAR